MDAAFGAGSIDDSPTSFVNLVGCTFLAGRGFITLSGKPKVVVLYKCFKAVLANDIDLDCSFQVSVRYFRPFISLICG